MDFKQGETLTRKEYIKKKKKEKRKNALSNISKRTWVMLAFIILCSAYVVYQFYIYNTKHRLVQTLPEEISSMKDYRIYYTSETYTYERGKNQLKSMSTTSNEKQTIEEGLGIYQINVKDNNIYGIKDGKLIKIDTNSKKITSKEIVSANVKGYAMYREDIYAYLSGEGVETGVYYVDEINEPKKIINTEVLQMLVDANNIYIVNKDKKIVRYNKDGQGETILANEYTSGGIIQDEKNIYFANLGADSKLYKIEKSTGKVVALSKTGATLNTVTNMDGYSFMGVYDNEIYYINTKDGNKLYKSGLSLKEDEKILEDNIQILDVINGTIFYKVNGDIGVYRYDIANKISSQVTSGRVLEFKAE